MVIRVQRFNDAGSEFIRVDFSLPCDKSPEWVSAKPSIQRFRLFRQKDCDAVLVGSMAGSVSTSQPCRLGSIRLAHNTTRFRSAKLCPVIGPSTCLWYPLSRWFSAISRHKRNSTYADSPPTPGKSGYRTLSASFRLMRHTSK